MSTIILLIIIVSLLTGCLNNSSGKYAEDFEFTLLNGEKKNMTDYQGKIVLLDFFGANCVPCQIQMTVLDKISDNYTKDELEIVSIDVWIVAGETPELVKQFISTFKEQVGIDLDWTFGVDTTDGFLFNKYVKNGVPMIYILDKNGNIYYSKSGIAEYQVLTEKLDELI